MRESALDRHMRMLRHPQRIEAALFQCYGQVGRRHRVFGEEDRRPDFHSPAFLSRT